MKVLFTASNSFTDGPRFVQTLNGAKLLILNGYSFSKNTMAKNGNCRYTCSNAASKKCKAYLHLNSDCVITKIIEEHNHEPPQYFVTKSGHYVRK